MKLNFNCPVCATHLHLTAYESSGPCPTCQNTLEIRVQISAHQAALGTEISDRAEKPDHTERKVKGWKCSGIPHGTAAFASQA